MATLRQWFTEAQVDWSTLVVIAHTISGEYPGWQTPKEVIRFEFSAPNALDLRPHPLLDREFYSGYGGPQAPRMIGQDKDRIYFIGTYDGSTWLESLWKDFEKYMNIENETPYVGG